MSNVVTIAVEPLDLPMTEPFEIALGTQTAAENVLVRVEMASGIVGYGEGAPDSPVTWETQTTALATVEAASELLVGEEIADYRRLIDDGRSAFPGMARRRLRSKPRCSTRSAASMIWHWRSCSEGHHVR